MTEVILTTRVGLDNGKRVRIPDIEPMTLAGYVLRLCSALRVPDWATVQALMSGADSTDDEAGEDAINALLKLLSGCDPDAVHRLLSEALTFMDIAPDPKHPEAWRPLMAADIQEMRTLGTVLMTFMSARLSLGG